MTLSYFQSLSFKLARTSLAIVLVLGCTVTFIQIYLDFQEQSLSIQKNIGDIILSGQSSAQRAVHTLDPELAEEVVKGLATYPFIHNVEILDEANTLMARRENELKQSATSKLTRFLRGNESLYRAELFDSSLNYEGVLIVIINNDLMLRPLYKRALYSLGSGLARNIILVLILAYLFNKLLTRPLIQLASNISEIDGNNPNGQRIQSIPQHDDDEISSIINAGNKLINQLEEHQDDLTERENQLRIILDSSPNQVFAIKRQGNFVFVNIATANFYNIEKEALASKNYFEVHEQCNPFEAQQLRDIVTSIEKSGTLARDIEQGLTNFKGKQHVMHMTMMPFSLYGQDCILVIGNDISERVAAEERVEKLAYYDVLTSLPNRNQLNELLVQHIEGTRKNSCEGAVLFIDIDDFKRINDTLGHSIGDELLLALSNKMSSQLSSTQTLGRLGGDEFILSIPNIAQNAQSANEQASILAERLLRTISAPIELGGHFFSIGASIGIATYPSSASDIEQLLRYADTAMYQAKASGRNCYRAFEASMAEEAHSRIELESEIRQGLNKREFHFHLQPLIDASSKQICGAEALIRWNHPERGLVRPGYFIPFLERSPMVSLVGAQILDQVCDFLAEGLAKNILPEGFRVSVNVSATEFFQQNFVQNVETTLEHHKLDGACLEIEITESIALDGLDNVIAKMKDLKRSNITFALDDFGTGYSSLNYLKKLPVDKIKIDKTFIDGVPHSKQDTALVGAVIDIAENLELKVVVEGIEEEEQASYFGENQHVIAQGYYFDAPMPPADFVEKYLKPKSC